MRPTIDTTEPGHAIPRDEWQALDHRWAEFINMVWAAADRRKWWHSLGPTLRVVAQLILDVPVEPCPHGVDGEVLPPWDVDPVDGPALRRLRDEAAAWVNWAETARSLHEAEMHANYGERRPVLNPGDDCANCGQPLELRCLVCGWTSEVSA